jgi:hypothetical protein
MSEATTSLSKRERRIKSAKNIGSILMYIGSAAITIPAVQRVKQTQNGFMATCAAGTGAMLSLGLGKIASNILDKTIDKTAGFFDDVKPKKPVENDSEDASAEENE